METLTGDQLFMALAAAIIPFLVSLSKRVTGGRLWPEVNGPALAVMWGAILGALYWLTYESIWLTQPENPLLMTMIGGGFAGFAAAGIHALGKDARDGSLAGKKQTEPEHIGHE